jgi:hypothetical protein
MSEVFSKDHVLGSNPSEAATSLSLVKEREQISVEVGKCSDLRSELWLLLLEILETVHPFWYACYTAADGRRLKKSTKQTDERKALEMARGLEKAAKEARGKRLTEARARDLVSQILEGVNGGEGLRIFTVRQWFGDFVKRKYKSRADKTAKRHEQMMDEFIDFLGPTADLNIAAVSSRTFQSFGITGNRSCSVNPQYGHHCFIGSIQRRAKTGTHEREFMRGD